MKTRYRVEYYWHGKRRERVNASLQRALAYIETIAGMTIAVFRVIELGRGYEQEERL